MFIPRGVYGHTKSDSVSTEQGKKPSISTHPSQPSSLTKPVSGRFAALAPSPSPPSQLPTPSGLTLLDRVKRSSSTVLRYSKEDILSKHKENVLPEYLEAFQARANRLISDASLQPVTITPIDLNEVHKVWMKSSAGQRGVRQSTSHVGGSNRGMVGDKQWGGSGHGNMQNSSNKRDGDLWDDVNRPQGGGVDGGMMDLAAMAKQSGELKEEMDRMAEMMALVDANEQKLEQEKKTLREAITQKRELLHSSKDSEKSIEGGTGREENVVPPQADPVTNFQPQQHCAPTESSAQQQVMPGQLPVSGVDAEAQSASRASLLSALGIMKPNVMQPHSAEEPVALPQWPVQARPPFGSLQNTSTSSSPLVASSVLPPLQHSSGSSSNTAIGGVSGLQLQQHQHQQADIQMYLQLEQQDHQQRSRVGELRHDILDEQARQQHAAEHAQAVKAAHSLPPTQHQGLMPEHQEPVVVPSHQGMAAAYLCGHVQPQQHQQPLRPAVQYNHFPHDQPPDLQPHQQQPTAVPSQQPVMWYYQDTQGKVQGPFSGQAMKSWLAAGYFAMDLPVRCGPVGEFIELHKRIAADAEPFAERLTETIVPPAVSMQLQQQQHLLQTQQDEARQERERLEWQQQERERAVALAQARVQTEQEAQQRAHEQQQTLLQQQQHEMEQQQAQMEKQQQQLQLQRKQLQLQREHIERELAKQKDSQQRSAAAIVPTVSPTPAAAAETPAPPPSIPSPWGTVPLSRGEAVQSLQSIQSHQAEAARKHAETAQQQYSASSQEEERRTIERNGSMGGPVQNLPSTAVWPSPPAPVSGLQRPPPTHTMAAPQSSSVASPAAEPPVDSQGIPKLPSVPVSLMATANPMPGRNLSQKERRVLEKQRSKQRSSEKMHTPVQQAWGIGATTSAGTDVCDGNDGSSKELKSMLGVGQQQQRHKVVWPNSNPQPKSLVEIQQEEERAAAAQQANSQQGGPTAPLGWASRVNPNAGTGRGMNLGLDHSPQPQQLQQPQQSQTTNSMQGPWGVQRPMVQGQGQGSGQWPQPGGLTHARNHDSVQQRGGEGGFWDPNAATTTTTNSSIKSPSLPATTQQTSSTNVVSTASQLTAGARGEGKGRGGLTGRSENVSNFGGQGIPTEMRPWATQQLFKIRGDGGDLSLLDFLMNVTVISDSLNLYPYMYVAAQI